ncbi:MAG: 5'/3'-nucleotidase SurE [bacterium]
MKTHSEQEKVTIVLTNDDGIHSEGLYALYRGLQDVAKVVIVAPSGERSACGHSITLSHPLRIEEVRKNDQFYGYAVSGTPVDCVKLAISVILESPPDMIISGINWGLNTGVHIMYSGTVSAAAEATILGIPAMAVSLAPVDFSHFDPSAQFARKVALGVLQQGLPPGTLLNINIPALLGTGQLPEVTITRHAQCFLKDYFQRRIDPRNNAYYWLDSEEMTAKERGDVDVEAVRSGKISITPIRFDLTDHQFIHSLRAWPILESLKER